MKIFILCLWFLPRCYGWLADDLVSRGPPITANTKWCREKERLIDYRSAEDVCGLLPVLSYVFGDVAKGKCRLTNEAMRWSKRSMACTFMRQRVAAFLIDVWKFMYRFFFVFFKSFSITYLVYKCSIYWKNVKPIWMSLRCFVSWRFSVTYKFSETLRSLVQHRTRLAYTLHFVDEILKWKQFASSSPKRKSAAVEALWRPSTVCRETAFLRRRTRRGLKM